MILSFDIHYTNALVVSRRQRLRDTQLVAQLSSNCSDRIECTTDVPLHRSTVNSVGSSHGLPVDSVLPSATSYATAGQCATSVVDCLEQWEHAAAYQQSPELSNEFVRESRAMPIRVGTSQSNPVHGNAQLGQCEEIYSQSRPGNLVPLANIGGHVATDYPASHLQSNPMGSGRQVPSPVVPTPEPFEYYSSGTELDSVMQNVQRVFDPQMRDQTVYQIDTTIAPIVRQYSTSSVDSIAANMECTGTAPLVCPTIQQVSQVLPAEPRAEGARLTAREGRVTKYPGELRAQDARVSTPLQGSCGRPADLHAGNM